MKRIERSGHLAPQDSQNVDPYLAGLGIHAQLWEKSERALYRVLGQWSLDGIHWVDFPLHRVVVRRYGR